MQIAANIWQKEEGEFWALVSCHPVGRAGEAEEENQDPEIHNAVDKRACFFSKTIHLLHHIGHVPSKEPCTTQAG